MTHQRRPPAAGNWLIAGLVGLFAAAMALRSVAGWDVTDAAWWLLLLLVAVVAWFWTRTCWHRDR